MRHKVTITFTQQEILEMLARSISATLQRPVASCDLDFIFNQSEYSPMSIREVSISYVEKA